ncbi:hypothetical protein [Candidatus Agathobaculum pullicola]|uniref:hypothetical protein n=1 Tax=Candidatus Agathobaculum pullicola TaxID=2838426 RepID=UPI003F92A6BE
MKTKEIARGGLLAAAAVALLYVGGTVTYIGPAACLMAGVATVVPLLRRARLKTAVTLYLAVSILSALFVPRKIMVAAYVLFCGLYPIVKFCIECYAPRRTQMSAKLAYFNIALVIAAGLAVFVFLPQFSITGFVRVAAVWVAADITFIIYDVALSRLIALLRRSLPPD